VGVLIGILNSLIVLASLFMICIILIQRGKGGGLAGAFGGVGGSSAFGTKAGDVFTKITIGVAIGWILSLMLLVVLTNRRTESAWGNDATSLTKELAPSSGPSKSKSPVSGTGTGAVPTPRPAAAAGSSKPAPASAPAPDRPALPEVPPIPPSKSAPRSG
jgi:preprotein translocase subunit SecG